jgi:hypothetical protein
MPQNVEMDTMYINHVKNQIQLQNINLDTKKKKILTMSSSISNLGCKLAPLAIRPVSNSSTRFVFFLGLQINFGLEIW